MTSMQIKIIDVSLLEAYNSQEDKNQHLKEKSNCFKYVKIIWKFPSSKDKFVLKVKS